VQVAVPAGAVSTEEVRRRVGRREVLELTRGDEKSGARETRGILEENLPPVEEDG
jgi:hypothetical protein